MAKPLTHQQEDVLRTAQAKINEFTGYVKDVSRDFDESTLGKRDVQMCCQHADAAMQYLRSAFDRGSDISAAPTQENESGRDEDFSGK